MQPEVSSFPTGGTSFVVSEMQHISILVLIVYIIALDCPSGTVYQQCGPVCPQTCDTVNDTSCSGGCIEGCFCPDGQVFANGDCINVADCEGTKAKYNHLIL